MNKQQTEMKEYLSQAFRIDQRIQSKMEQVASLNDLATRATATYSDMIPRPVMLASGFLAVKNNELLLREQS